MDKDQRYKSPDQTTWRADDFFSPHGNPVNMQINEQSIKNTLLKPGKEISVEEYQELNRNLYAQAVNLNQQFGVFIKGWEAVDSKFSKLEEFRIDAEEMLGNHHSDLELLKKENAEIKESLKNIENKFKELEKLKGSHNYKGEKKDPNQPMNIYFYNWPCPNWEPVNLFQTWGWTQYLNVERVIEIDWRKDYSCVLTVRGGVNKYVFSCLIKSTLNVIQESKVRLPKGFMKWVQSDDVVLINQYENQRQSFKKITF